MASPVGAQAMRRTFRLVATSSAVLRARGGGGAAAAPGALRHARTTATPSNTSAPSPVIGSSTAFGAPSAFKENRQQVIMSERQEAILLERLPKDFLEKDLVDRFTDCGIQLDRDNILLMRSRLGLSIGRALVKLSEPVSYVLQVLPQDTKYRPMDRNDIEAFVEQCERFYNLSDDLRRLALPQNFLRVLTITEVPPTYGRKDVAHVLKEHCGVTVEPRDVVFRFKRWGRQSDTCFVLCPQAQDVDHCINKIQELAVPKRAAYGSLFGAAFLWSSRSTLFLSDPHLDFLVNRSMFWVFTTGWQEDMNVDEIEGVMATFKIFPERVVRHPIPADMASAFFMKFHDMKVTKAAMRKLRRLRWRWRLKKESPFFAYPRRIDIHRSNEEKYDDEDSGGDSDIDEPVWY